MTLITIIIGAIACFLMIILLGSLLFTFQYIWQYKCHRCKHCGHFMAFKGLKEEGDDAHYLFHCPKCGAWEQIQKGELSS
jgi:phage FluMu protein Com